MAGREGHGLNRGERHGLGLVAMAVLFFSTSPVLVRWAAESLSPFEIAAGRLTTAALVVLGLALAWRQPLPRRHEWGRFLLFGLVTALHFGLYIASLNFTTIAHSLALIYTAPIFVALFSRFFLQEGLPLRKWAGILVTILGVGVLAGLEPQLTPRMLWGDLMALGSAISFGLYSVAGRSQRDRYGLFAYAGSVYGAAALWLLPAAGLTFSSGGYTARAIASVVALGLFPLALGHTLYNAALRRVNATYVNLIATQEVTGGILLGMLLLGEIPSLTAAAGVLATLFGIVLVVL